MSSILTETELRNLAPDLDLSPYSAATISGMINAATLRMQNFCNVTGFDQQTVTGERTRTKVTTDGDLVVRVKRKPIVSVSAIRISKGAMATDITLTDGAGNALYDIDSSATAVYVTGAGLTYLGRFQDGAMSLVSLRNIRAFTTISYVGGYSTITDDLKQACVLYVRDIVSTKANPSGVDSFSQGSYSVTFTSNSSGKSKLALQAEQILQDGDYVNVDIF
jgi:hypothetical protein